MAPKNVFPLQCPSMSIIVVYKKEKGGTRNLEYRQREKREVKDRSAMLNQLE